MCRNFLRDFCLNIFSFQYLVKIDTRYLLIRILGIKIKINILNILKFKVLKESQKKSIKKYLEYKNNRKPDLVCYTCITGDYDKLIQHKYINKDWDYICFTDNQSLINKKQVGIWQIKPLAYDTNNNLYNNRWHKFFPHKCLKNYSKSIYVDGNINILTDYLSKQAMNFKIPLALPLHYSSSDLYDELDYIVYCKKDSPQNMQILKDLYLFENFPKGLGFAENNIIYRQHENTIVQKIMEDWWQMINRYSKRDQTSLAYVMWKNGLRICDFTLLKNARYDYNADYGVINHKQKEKI